VRLALAAVLLTGCGRLSFDARGDGSVNGDDDGPRDSVADAKVCTQLLCDAFEAPALAPIWTPFMAANATVMLDPTMAHGGASSLHFHLPATASNVGSRALINQASTLPSPIYVRAFVRLTAVAALNNRIELMLVAENTTNQENAVMLMNNGLAVYNQWTDGTINNAALPPTNTWLCLTWHVARATTATGSLTLAGDVPPAGLSNVPTDGPALEVMGFGLVLYGQNQPSAQSALDLWLDDLIVDDAPVTCSD